MSCCMESHGSTHNSECEINIDPDAQNNNLLVVIQSLTYISNIHYVKVLDCSSIEIEVECIQFYTVYVLLYNRLYNINQSK